MSPRLNVVAMAGVLGASAFFMPGESITCNTQHTSLGPGPIGLCDRGCAQFPRRPHYRSPVSENACSRNCLVNPKHEPIALP